MVMVLHWGQQGDIAENVSLKRHEIESCISIWLLLLVGCSFQQEKTEIWYIKLFLCICKTDLEVLGLVLIRVMFRKQLDWSFLLGMDVRTSVCLLLHKEIQSDSQLKRITFYWNTCSGGDRRWNPNFRLKWGWQLFHMLQMFQGDVTMYDLWSFDDKSVISHQRCFTAEGVFMVKLFTCFWWIWVMWFQKNSILNKWTCFFLEFEVLIL